MTGKSLYSLSIARNGDVVTAAMREALSRHVPPGAVLTIFVADRIHVFNQIARGQHERLDFAWSGDERTDLALKRDFIAKARRDLGVDPSWTWEIINIDDLQGPRLAGIYRAVRILYQNDHRIAQDVESYCQAYFDGMREKPADSRLALAMGRLFVLEEVAINIHLRCVAGYRDEFYTGAFLPVILNLYEGRYARDPWFLARAPRSPVRFHEWDGEAWSARSF